MSKFTRLLAFVFLVSLLSTVLADAQWMPEIRLTTNESIQWLSSIVADPQGNMHVAWLDDRNNRTGWKDIYYTKLNSSGAVVISNMQITFGNRIWSGDPPSLDTDENGNVYFIWLEPTIGILYKKFDNSSRNLTGALLVTNMSEPVTFAVDAQGNAYVVWTDNYWVTLYYKMLDPSGRPLTGDVRIIPRRIVGLIIVPSVGVDLQGNVHVVWEDLINGNWDLYYIKLANNGVNLTSPRRLTSNQADQHYHSMAVDFDGSIHLAWEDERHNAPEVYYMKLDNNGNITVPEVRVSDLPHTSGGPSIAVDSQRNAHLAWWEGAIYYAALSDGAHLIPNSRATFNDRLANGPSIAIGLNDSAHITWDKQNYNSPDIFYRRSALGPLPPVKPASIGPVRIANRTLYVNNKQFTIKGAGYQPTPIGLAAPWGNNDIFNFLHRRDFPLLRNMNANTVRTWARVTNRSFLDAAYNNGNRPIYVIMGYWIDYFANLADPQVRANYINDFSNYVREYKDHPAVLMWAIGNEVNRFYGGNMADWYTLANEMARQAYLIENATYHPVTVVDLDLQYIGNPVVGADDASFNYVDAWGTIVYRGQTFGNYFSDYAWRSRKPLWIAEYGIDALDNRNLQEYQSVQAAWDIGLWKEIVNASSIAIGGTVMAYSDEWWKAQGSTFSHDYGGYPTNAHPDGYSNEEWWGLMAIQDNGTAPDIMIPRQAYYVYTKEFNPAKIVVQGIPRLSNTVTFLLEDREHPNALYVLGMSLGTMPGIALSDGRTIPLNPDILLYLSLQIPQAVGLANNIGMLDAQGKGRATLAIPNIPPLVSQTFYFSFVTITQGQYPLSSIADAVNVTIVQ